MADIHQLYQRTILEHSRHPRGFRVLEGPHIVSAELRNVTCGDRILVAVDIDSSHEIRDIAFQGAGCAICMASASLMTESTKGLDVAGAHRLRERFVALVRSSALDDGARAPNTDLGELDAFRGVSRFPVRIDCALLAWFVLRDALSVSGARSSM